MDSFSSLILIDFLSRIKKLGRAKFVVLNLKIKWKVSGYFLYILVLDYLVKMVNLMMLRLCGQRFVGLHSLLIYLIMLYMCKFGGFNKIN